MKQGCWILIILLAMAPLHAGQVYKWVDEQGNVHFGDRPHGQAAETVRVRPPPASALATPNQGSRQEKTQKLLRAWDEERREKDDKKAKVAAENEEAKRRCHDARDELRGMDAGKRYYNLDQQGERQYLNETELKQRRARWQAEVDRWCK